MTLKIRSRSPKSNQLVPPSQQCICASLVKIRPSVQKITHGNEATRTLTLTQTPPPTGSAPKTMSPHFGWGDITNQVYTGNFVTKISLCLTSSHLFLSLEPIHTKIRNNNRARSCENLPFAYAKTKSQISPVCVKPGWKP